jgi:hypothetical protein
MLLVSPAARGQRNIVSTAWAGSNVHYGMLLRLLNIAVATEVGPTPRPVVTS